MFKSVLIHKFAFRIFISKKGLKMYLSIKWLSFNYNILTCNKLTKTLIVLVILEIATKNNS